MTKVQTATPVRLIVDVFIYISLFSLLTFPVFEEKKHWHLTWRLKTEPFTKIWVLFHRKYFKLEAQMLPCKRLTSPIWFTYLYLQICVRMPNFIHITSRFRDMSTFMESGWKFLVQIRLLHILHFCVKCMHKFVLIIEQCQSQDPNV